MSEVDKWTGGHGTTTGRIRDAQGLSPWVGRAYSHAEYKALPLPKWQDPYPDAPQADLVIDGIDGLSGHSTSFRLGQELWLPGIGYLYRESHSCMTTQLNARMRASIQYLNEELGVGNAAKLYMTECVTPMYSLMAKRFLDIQGSEYFPGVPLGSMHEGVRCEDLSALTFGDNSFDLIMSFDVLEHVPDYRAALSEMARVLKPGGKLLMTAPIHLPSYQSHVRAKMCADGRVEHILDPEYHGNPLGPPSLCFTSFGFDLIDEMRSSGFSESYVELYANVQLGYWGPPQPLIIGVK